MAWLIFAVSLGAYALMWRLLEDLDAARTCWEKATAAPGISIEPPQIGSLLTKLPDTHRCFLPNRRDFAGVAGQMPCSYP
jgi:hypothetical protein